MRIQHEKEENKGRFYMKDGEKTIANMTYSMAGEQKMIIDHTDVDENYQGQGLGKKLLLDLVAYVRENEIKVIPLCPFARAAFQKDASIKDVL